MNINGNEVKIDQYFFQNSFADTSSQAYQPTLVPMWCSGSAVAFQRVADAHHVLLDPEKRKAFDEGTTEQ